MSPEQIAALVKPIVCELGEAFGNDARTMRRVREMGLTGWSFYVAGRGGALGDVRWDTAAAAMGFIAPEAIRDGWESAKRVASPTEIAEESLAQCCRWGRENLTDFFGIRRLVELGERVVINIQAAGMPLFAAWRAMPIPDDGLGARAAVLLFLLREHRGAAHLMAVAASGLTPLEAIIAGPDGVAEATAFGWTPPYPSYEPLLRRKMRAEALADRIAGPAYAGLTVVERQELFRLLASVADEINSTRG